MNPHPEPIWRRSDRFDERPVLTEPAPEVPDLPPAPPMATPLGQLFRLAVWCKTCHGKNGQHYPSCRARTTPKLCRGCQEAVEAPGRAFYCEACRRQRCVECARYAGTHGPRCRYDRRQRRTFLGEHHGLVSVQDILDLYIDHRREAVRIARRLAGPLVAEDLVHDTITFLLAKRDLLRFVPTRGYFLVAVRHAAYRWKLYAWERYRVAMDPTDLLVAERMMYGLTRGRRAAANVVVQLPDEPEERDSMGGVVPRQK